MKYDSKTVYYRRPIESCTQQKFVQEVTRGSKEIHLCFFDHSMCEQKVFRTTFNEAIM